MTLSPEEIAMSEYEFAGYCDGLRKIAIIPLMKYIKENVSIKEDYKEYLRLKELFKN